MLALGKNDGTAARGVVKSVALIAATFVFAAQLVAVAHYHQGRFEPSAAAQAAVVPDSGLCALCILAFHSPINPAAQAAISQPQGEIHAAESAVPNSYVSHPLPSWLTRAPPPSAI
jgi:hypothetical protein